MRPRPPVWPAYLVAAACFALAIGTSLSNLTLTSQLRQAQASSQRESARASSLLRNLSLERTALADLESPSAQHYGAANAQVVSSNGRLYVLMSALPMPPRGRIYQAWALERGAASMTPSVRFIPDRHGIAVVALGDVDASRTTAVAVSVEPDSGSKAPTSRFVLDVTLGD
ncbi:MAG: anti-sigma factor [Candidatus Tyrphobacter sp.]